MKELDVLFERYLEHRFDQASPAEHETFLRLLQQEDPDIWAWVFGYAAPPAEFADVIQRLQQHP